MAGVNIVVIGNGMVGHKFIDLLCRRESASDFNITVFGEERYLAYDRVHLSEYFSGKTADDLALTTLEYYQQLGIQIFTNQKIIEIDRTNQTVISSEGTVVPYDKLVLATGSYPFVLPIPNHDVDGTFVYRTLDDLDAIQSYAQTSQVGVVMGGGLLGLECANALYNLGLETHVVDIAPHLMPRQLDAIGGGMLRQKIEELGIRVHTGKSTTEVIVENGQVAGLAFKDGDPLPADMIVFSAGIRPRDELAKQAGLAVGPRGGIMISETCQTSDPNIYAIGECALYNNQIYGLVAPGYLMAEVAVDQITHAAEKILFLGADMSTQLKLLGVDVASFGEATSSTSPNAREIFMTDYTTGIYKKIVVDMEDNRLLGGILVGDASDYGMLVQFMKNDMVLPPHPEDLIIPQRSGEAGPLLGGMTLPDNAKICTCENVSKGMICDVIREQGLSTVGEIKTCTKAGTGCGGCVPLLTTILKDELKKAGVQVLNHLCEHFPYSRQELYHIIRINRIETFEEVLGSHGKGLGCEICKPTVASILASTWNEYILDDSHATLQDTNDYFLANIQRDGTYSVVPRVPGGEITPDKLIVIGQVAKEFDLYLKITGGQRIDMFGARVDQLPQIWKRLVDAGFESGHAYGKALRTVKSCVGTTWCRYGQQDSVSFAIEVENRYRGLRSPHKLKAAVSGCTRECAEAQGKDFGMIATEKGYNLYVCGNGGMKPRHATLLAEDLTEEQVIAYLDRFLMFYIRTADRLQRTSTWFDNLEGGIDYLRQVIIHDSLGICEELEREMEHIVGTYQCEWKTTLENPEKLRRFRHFVDDPHPDPNLVYVEMRGQKRPAFPEEKMGS